jgi:hypothetical protein
MYTGDLKALETDALFVKFTTGTTAAPAFADRRRAVTPWPRSTRS